MTKKITARFIISEKFRHQHNQVEDEVKVVLEVNYEISSYGIYPIHGNKMDFRFLNGSHMTVSRWKALLNCIQQANEMGAKELVDNKEWTEKKRLAKTQSNL